MTREEARREIDSLDFYLQNHTDDYGEESHTAMMMAIKALEKDKTLEQEPCKDTIGRQAAIDAIMGQPPEPHYPSWYAAQIEKLPAAQPERKKPVFKTGESVYHISYADGTGGFEKNKWADWTCPDCGWFVGEQYIPRRHNQQKCNYCAKCGCAIDWSDADMRGEQDERSN